MSKDIVQVDPDITESQLLDELVALALPPRRPGGVTVHDLMERGLTEAMARRILRKQEREGLIYAVQSVENGQPLKVYYRKSP